MTFSESPHQGAAALVAAMLLAASTDATAQQPTASAVSTADDAFGATVGFEKTGIYSDADIRGFNPAKAGNSRFGGVYFDQQTSLSNRVRTGSRIRVGIAALDYPFPRPPASSTGSRVPSPPSQASPSPPPATTSAAGWRSWTSTAPSSGTG